MKKNAVLWLSVIIFVNGCQPGTIQHLAKKNYKNIAGTWQSQDSAWQVTISESGKVTSAIHPLGEAIIKPNKTTYIKMKDGQKSSYKSGDFTLSYDEETREMQVTLVVKNIHIQFLNNEIKGNTETIILGTVSDDFTTWQAGIVDVFDYGPRFPQGKVGTKYELFIKQ